MSALLVTAPLAAGSAPLAAVPASLTAATARLAALDPRLATAPAWVGHGPHPGPWLVLFPLVWFLWLAAVVAVVVTVLRRHRLRHGGWPAARAEAVLRERFARGEVDEAEYRSRLETLRGTPQ